MRSGEQMLQQIVEKSALDAEFRQQLLADPKSTISQELDITIPDSMTIQVHESDMQTVHLALPPDPNITEEQLEAISAGLCCCW
ncbi:MAG: NHLP leader peptide family natural product precursor [Gammaproteobacteria bacterium]|nr:NHLP leader peptide family natural product precursor [Gammaproteobacteria bacterium]MXZ28110.1 NHLP leader peptide family natural product precursor [Gammaproteobacteria bacterium]MYF57876.1 NHLP leader peptide family natural product precursor [Gammaproteobacteria bacterium]MYH34918.1 NHLP leader peptide family natural product precursor [Gammaproteobacteria bacterium]MYL00815.1 NHLP leader peptide family natural product precursor [Gammaproteobacteria bacterium]